MGHAHMHAQLTTSSTVRHYIKWSSNKKIVCISVLVYLSTVCTRSRVSHLSKETMHSRLLVMGLWFPCHASFRSVSHMHACMQLEVLQRKLHQLARHQLAANMASCRWVHHLTLQVGPSPDLLVRVSKFMFYHFPSGLGQTEIIF